MRYDDDHQDEGKLKINEQIVKDYIEKKSKKASKRKQQAPNSGQGISYKNLIHMLLFVNFRRRESNWNEAKIQELYENFFTKK